MTRPLSARQVRRRLEAAGFVRGCEFTVDRREWRVLVRWRGVVPVGVLIGWWAEVLDWGEFWPTFRAAAIVTVGIIGIICAVMLIALRPGRSKP